MRRAGSVVVSTNVRVTDSLSAQLVEQLVNSNIVNGGAGFASSLNNQIGSNEITGVNATAPVVISMSVVVVIANNDATGDNTWYVIAIAVLGAALLGLGLGCLFCWYRRMWCFKPEVVKVEVMVGLPVTAPCAGMPISQGIAVDDDGAPTINGFSPPPLAGYASQAPVWRTEATAMPNNSDLEMNAELEKEMVK